MYCIELLPGGIYCYVNVFSMCMVWTNFSWDLNLLYFGLTSHQPCIFITKQIIHSIRVSFIIKENNPYIWKKKLIIASRSPCDRQLLDRIYSSVALFSKTFAWEILVVSRSYRYSSCTAFTFPLLLHTQLSTW